MHFHRRRGSLEWSPKLRQAVDRGGSCAETFPHPSKLCPFARAKWTTPPSPKESAVQPTAQCRGHSLAGDTVGREGYAGCRSENPCACGYARSTVAVARCACSLPPCSSAPARSSRRLSRSGAAISPALTATSMTTPPSPSRFQRCSCGSTNSLRSVLASSRSVGVSPCCIRNWKTSSAGSAATVRSPRSSATHTCYRRSASML